MANTHLGKMDFDLLRTFIAVVDNGSFTRAAGQIYRTQSAISMQIKRLETQLNKSLFIRDGRNLKLTAEGKALVSYARRLLSLHDEALKVLKSKEQVSNLTIGCPDDYSRNLLPRLIEILRLQLPSVKISVITANSGELRQRLDNGELDLTILTRSPNTQEGVLIYQDYGVWVSHHERLLKKRPLPLVLFESSCKFHSSVIDGLEKSGISYDLICDTSNSSLLVELIRTEQVVTVLASKTVPEDLISLADFDDLPKLPIAEIIVSLKGANQSIAGILLQDLAQQLAET